MPLTRGIGKQIQVGISRETTRGAASAVATFWLAADDWSLDEKWKNAQDVQVYGIIESEQSETRVKAWSEGSLKVPISANSSGLLLYSMFGAVTTSTKVGETVVFNSAFTVAQNVQHQSVTLFMHDPIVSVDYVYANTVVTKMDIDYSLGKFVEITASIKGMKGSSVATLTPAQIVETRFVPQYLTFSQAANNAALPGSTIKIKSLKLSINSNEEDDDVMGSISPRDFLNKEFKVEGTIEAIWQNESDFKTNSIANTPQAMRISMVNSDVTIGSTSNPALVIDLAKVYVTDFSKPFKIKDIMYQTIKFNAAYDPTPAFMIRGTLTNTVASY